jgi:hypothetical protein
MLSDTDISWAEVVKRRSCQAMFKEESCLVAAISKWDPSLGGYDLLPYAPSRHKVKGLKPFKDNIS